MKTTTHELRFAATLALAFAALTVTAGMVSSGNGVPPAERQSNGLETPDFAIWR